MTTKIVEATGRVHLRKSPSRESEPLGFLTKGTKVELVEGKAENGFELIKTADGNWYGNREPRKRAAWVSASWLRPSEGIVSEVAYVSSRTANVRTGPSLDQPRVRQLYVGKKVMIIAREGEWAQVSVGDESAPSGYIYAPLLRTPKQQPVEILAAFARNEWKRFSYGRGMEYREPYRSRIGDYWKKGTGLNYDGGDRHRPWSSAFVSFCITAHEAYRDFPRSSSHSTYINWAIRNRKSEKTGSFLAYRIAERRPQVGDLIVKGRAGSGVSYDNALRKGSYESHGDIVVGTYGDAAYAIGGNVNHSVALTTFRLDKNGYLPGSQQEFAVLANHAD